MPYGYDQSIDLTPWIELNSVCLPVQCFYLKGAFFWGHSGYSYSGLGITEYTEFHFRKEHSLCFRSGNGIGGDLRTTISAAV